VARPFLNAASAHLAMHWQLEAGGVQAGEIALAW
jgi:hypothetical protein